MSVCVWPTKLDMAREIKLLWCSDFSIGRTLSQERTKGEKTLYSVAVDGNWECTVVALDGNWTEAAAAKGTSGQKRIINRRRNVVKMRRGNPEE